MTPAHPKAWTVTTSKPSSPLIKSWGRFSSSRTRTVQQRLACQFERGNGLAARDRWKLAEELVQGVATLQVVEERLVPTNTGVPLKISGSL